MVFKSVLDINNDMAKEFIKLGIGLIILVGFVAIMFYYGGNLY
jgi:ABC-type bacteriocin/lantibiotic exporter with double-glycine peptidase domain